MPGSVFHLDEVWSVMDMDVRGQSAKYRDLLVEHGFVAHKEDMKSIGGRQDGTLDGSSGGIISPHGIKCDAHDAVPLTSGSSGFLNIEDPPTAVGATRHTDAVTLFPLVAVLTVN